MLANTFGDVDLSSAIEELGKVGKTAEVVSVEEDEYLEPAQESVLSLQIIIILIKLPLSRMRRLDV